MEEPQTNKKQHYHILNTFLVFGIMLTILLLLLTSYWQRVEQENKLEMTNRFISFEKSVQGFVNGNALMIAGFSAYIETFDDYKDDEVYSFLESLIKGNEKYIKNIGIVKDTTIIWNYPKEENKSAIGVDLSKVPGQAEAINQVKWSFHRNFSGPVELVQGGYGYVIRVPIMKDGNYWGVASIVIDSNELVKLFDQYSKDSQLEVAIYKKSEPDKLIYGDELVVDDKKVVMNSMFMDEDWTFCIRPVTNTLPNALPSVIGLLLVGLALIGYLTYRSFIYFKNHEDMKNKNMILKSSAIRDKLTDTYNRNYFDARIAEEIKFANNYGSPVSLIYFDLNFFKRVNDTYGHAYGDSVLRDIAAIVKKLLRQSDVFARWGGDEFALLMPNTALLGAEIAAEKIRIAILSIDHPTVGLVSASIGVGEYKLGESSEAWFKRVDKALYYAKADKDNSVCASDFEGNIMCVMKKS
ncbi:MAG: diguanylate cyclase [Fusobacteria bacterium]|nr:MAG: diguanylate cyclase [Fusobacteriota bacterium]KAF0228544.1 MAG: diguanylate [Fusobacteriota bacterium]